MITIKEIALLAGVSIGTVDRVLNNRGRVSRETKDRILNIVENEGYRKNIVASQLSNPKASHFAVLMPLPEQNDSFWQIIKSGIEIEKERLNYFKLNLDYYFYDRFDSVSYTEKFKDAIDADPDGILLAPLFAAETLSMADHIPERIKVVLMNTDLPDFNNISYIGQDSFESGRTAAKLMSLLNNKKGTIAVIEVHPHDYHINIRAEGFKKFTTENTECDIKTYLLPAENDMAELEKCARLIKAENDDLTGLFVPNSSVHFFVDLLNNSHSDKRIFIIGYDLVEANALRLQKGEIDFLINQQPRKQGELALEYLFKSTVLQEEVKGKKFLPIEIICRENLESYIENNRQER